MKNTEHVFMIGSILFSILLCLILFVRKSDVIFANRLLCGTFAGYVWYCGNFFLDITGKIKEIPFLFGFGIPLYYATPVFAYLYVRTNIKQQKRFLSNDWIHFLPSILSFIATIPFYIEDNATKVVFLDNIYRNYDSIFHCKIGLIPNVWHFYLRPLQCMIYVGLQWSLVISASKQRWDTIRSTEVKRWILIFVSLQTLIYLSLSIATIQGHFYLPLKVNILSAVHVPFNAAAFILFGLSFYLFFFPEVLYGVRVQSTQQPVDFLVTNLPESDQQNAGELDKKTETNLSQALVLQYAHMIEAYMAASSFFRKHGATINDLAQQIHISPRNVSYVLNQHFGQRFTDFINQYRINYIKQRIDKNDWKTLTLEGLAVEAGFSSRSTFSAAFKKHTGLCPSDYIISTNTTI